MLKPDSSKNKHGLEFLPFCTSSTGIELNHITNRVWSKLDLRRFQ